MGYRTGNRRKMMVGRRGKGSGGGGGGKKDLVFSDAAELSASIGEEENLDVLSEPVLDLLRGVCSGEVDLGNRHSNCHVRRRRVDLHGDARGIKKASEALSELGLNGSRGPSGLEGIELTSSLHLELGHLLLEGGDLSGRPSLEGRFDGGELADAPPSDIVRVVNGDAQLLDQRVVGHKCPGHATDIRVVLRSDRVVDDPRENIVRVHGELDRCTTSTKDVDSRRQDLLIDLGHLEDDRRLYKDHDEEKERGEGGESKEGQGEKAGTALPVRGKSHPRIIASPRGNSTHRTPTQR